MATEFIINPVYRVRGFLFPGEPLYVEKTKFLLGNSCQKEEPEKDHWAKEVPEDEPEEPDTPQGIPWQ